jgi:hypothetical protein
MVKTKVIEIRDRGTFIPALAIKVTPNTMSATDYLLERAGWHESSGIYLMALERPWDCQYDPYQWPSITRTMPLAHMALAGEKHPEIKPDRAKHFDEVEDGEVIDVQYILGETQAPKLSERVTAPL